MNAKSNTKSSSSNQEMWGMWWHAIRPKTLLASISPVLIGLACANAQGLATHWPTAFNTLLCAVALQILANLANDYFDGIDGIDRLRKFGPMRLTQSGKVDPQQMRLVLALLTLAIIVMAIPLMLRGGNTIIAVGILAILGAFLYTSTPLSFSRHALGELTAGIYFGPVAVWGSAFLQGDLPRPLNILLVGIIPGLLAAAIMSINNLRDMESDGVAGKKTLAVLIGLPYARLVPAFCIGMAYLFTSVLAMTWSWYFLLPLLTLPLAYSIWLKVLEGTIDQGLNFALAQTGKLTFFFSVLLALAFVVYGIYGV